MRRSAGGAAHAAATPHRRPRVPAALGASLLFAVVFASCAAEPGGARRGAHEGEGRGAGEGEGGVTPKRATGASCERSSVITSEACAAKVRPPSNRGSDAGCRSDAECVHGKQGRCIENAALAPRDPELHPTRPSRAARALLAEPPPPPPKSICVYDACEKNAECGPSARCGCDEVRGRNACIALDSCASDGDCARGMLCQCGASGQPNHCMPGDCRSDADCPGTKCEPSHSGGSFCRTPNDRCRTSKECEKQEMWGVCEMRPGDDAWACHDYPFRLPG